MIDLDRTRAELLAEIEAQNLAANPVRDITDPRIANTDVHLRLRGHGRDDLFPLLEIVLSDRFTAVSRAHLLPDLLIPLRNALGNASKHGNGGNPAKAVVVEMAATCKGLLIAITDEGSGFDVARTLQRYRAQQAYFANHGCGFRNLDRAMSTVSYEHGGRTILLCYRPPEQLPQSFSSCPPGPPWLPEFSNARSLISCRVYPSAMRAGHACGRRYAVRFAGAESGEGEVDTRILTGRLHATEASARADFEAARRLYDARISKRVRTPRPVARATIEPRLVFYDFNPWMNLREYLTHRRSLRSVRHASERIGQTLAALHKSQVTLPGTEPNESGATLDMRIARAEARLQTVAPGSDLIKRFNDCVQQPGERCASLTPRKECPIHGALEWDCILYGVDGDFYLYRFEECRRSDPGFDLGGFGADLLCFTLTYYDDAAYRMCRDEFLTHYNAEAQDPMREEGLHFYTVLTLCERLRPRESDGNHRNAHLIAALGAALRGGALPDQSNS